MQKFSDKAFMDAFYRQVPPEDLAGWKKEDLATVAKSMGDWTELRKTGQQKIRVFNPDQKKDGWHVPHTVVQLVNDDMPFIVDSVSAAIAFERLAIDALFHPVLKFTRDKAGNVKEIHADNCVDNDHVVESLMHIHLEQLLSDEGCKKLQEMLIDTLQDVRAATGDWQTMMKKVDRVIEAGGGKSGGETAAIHQEAWDFLSYVRNNNFTFLGYSAYEMVKGELTSVRGSALGVIKNGHNFSFFGKEEAKILETNKWPVIVSKVVDSYATVHRRVPLDAIMVRTVDAKGKLTGMHLFVGLFTSSTYSCRTAEVPIVRRKVAEVTTRAGFTKGSHDAKALEHILEKMPRDELFHISVEALYKLATGILRLQAKQRIALFTHRHPMGQYVSCLIYVPRDKYNTHFREQASAIISGEIRGEVVNHFTTLDDSPLARLLFIVRLEGEADYDAASIESKLIDLGRAWDERLKHVLTANFGKIRGAQLAVAYGRAFSSAYHESIHIDNVVHDVRRLEAMEASGDEIAVDFYHLQDMATGELRLKVYHRNKPVPLSDILPILENMGLKSMSELPYEVHPHGREEAIWIHDFVLRAPADIHMRGVRENVEETFLQVWSGGAENDGLNQLALRANLTWHQVRILRTYSGFMRQARFPYSRAYVEQVLCAYPDITGELVNLFQTRHDPKNGDKALQKSKPVSTKIDEMLQAVQKLDHDRILRSFRNLIEKTLRTNYYQRDAEGNYKTYLAIKIDSKNVLELPLPRPHVEIFVYSSRVEGVHLRGGEIARGGIRWSDRLDDFRTEVLGLVKAQIVKNTVIVPTGSKGGFVVKQPSQAVPGEAGKSISPREALQKEGIECYKIFIQALLDMTDNNVKGKVVRPKDMLFHDGIDPYLVVAADKGTATFSDIANKLSMDNGFWLNDAFASGGSAGYDHKKMGITAKGGWECVKRHFREMGKNIQKEPFTAVGVGDMGGDVFGNAMLLSKQTKLIGAFNHVHIFCDPNPDPEKSFAERARLFKERGGWDAYNKDLLSPGGAVFERSAKSLKLSAAIRKAFDIDQENVTPDELIRAILKAQVELIWFGGIGTYLKSSQQSNADADDKTNDALRIDGRDVRAKVVGEGANLAITQLARVEYARKGGRINTDFIDNSAGVDCSDHEVNIKILLGDVAARSKMTIPQRDKLLEKMTDDVAELVLRDNYQQSQALSLLEVRSKEDLSMHQDFIREMEKTGMMKRSLEGLPDDEGFARLTNEGRGLTRPELSVLLSYSKIVNYSEILNSSIPDTPVTEKLLFSYFPKALQGYAHEVRGHKLRREIIATQVVNTLVNRMGPVFVQSRVAKTGRSAADVVRAFMIVTEAYDLPALWQEIEGLDNKVPCAVQMSALHEIYLVVKRAVTWFLRFEGENLNVAEQIADFQPGISVLRKTIRDMVPESLKAAITVHEAILVNTGMPADMADDIAAIKLLSSASDIVNISRTSNSAIESIAAIYFEVGERTSLDWLRSQASAIVPANSWQGRVLGSVMDDYYIHQAAVTSAILSSVKKGGKVDRKIIDAWFEKHDEELKVVQKMVSELRALPKVETEMLVLMNQKLGQIVSQVSSHKNK